jgi:glycosyltransferase involved in cell wall biosynthesis
MNKRVAINYHFNDRDWHGGRNYFASLLQAIAACGPHEFSFVLVVGHHTETTLPEQFPSLEVIRTSLMDRMSWRWLVRQFNLRALNADWLMAGFLRSNRIDILSHSMPIGRARGLKTMSWLYDFQFLHLPELWNPKHVRWARQWYGTACRTGDAVVLSSESALADMRRIAGQCHAVPHVLRFVSNPVDFSRMPSLDALRERYGIPQTYFYLPNQFWENKNHRLAIDALVLLRKAGIDATIVCTGKPLDGRQPDYFDRLMSQCRSSAVSEQFKVLGIVPYADTQGLMRHARAVINPSRFEGWSTTVEEAKTLNKALFLSDIPVHREQAPQRGAFFAVNDAEKLAALMADALLRAPAPVQPEWVCADHARRLRQFGEEYLAILRSL